MKKIIISLALIILAAAFIVFDLHAERRERKIEYVKSDLLRPPAAKDRPGFAIGFDDWRKELLSKNWAVYELTFISAKEISGMQECVEDSMIYARHAGFDGETLALPANFFGEGESRSSQNEATMITWIVGELCANVEHAPKGSRSLVAVKLDTETGLFCIVYYNNMGSRELEKKLRQRRVRTANSERGYGLALIRYLAKAANGAMAAYSSPDEGTQIKIAIPLPYQVSPLFRNAPPASERNIVREIEDQV